MTLSNYLQIAAKRREANPVPDNLMQYYVGENLWIRSFRDWLQNRYKTSSGLFLTLEDAIAFAQNVNDG